jgi:hypothetical protein
MHPLKAIIATAVAAGFASVAIADTPSYVGGPKGSVALPASRAPASFDAYMLMRSAPVTPQKPSPWRGSPHP